MRKPTGPLLSISFLFLASAPAHSAWKVTKDFRRPEFEKLMVEFDAPRIDAVVESYVHAMRDVPADFKREVPTDDGEGDEPVPPLAIQAFQGLQEKFLGPLGRFKLKSCKACLSQIGVKDGMTWIEIEPAYVFFIAQHAKDRASAIAQIQFILGHELGHHIEYLYWGMLWRRASKPQLDLKTDEMILHTVVDALSLGILKNAGLSRAGALQAMLSMYHYAMRKARFSAEEKKYMRRSVVYRYQVMEHNKALLE